MIISSAYEQADLVLGLLFGTEAGSGVFLPNVD
jgi:hypothetical protein